MDYSGYRIVKFNAPSHSKGGTKLDILGRQTSNPDKAAVEIEKKEVVSRDNNGNLYVYSDKLGSNKIAMKADKIKGDNKLARNTRKQILNKAKRYNKQELEKLLQEKLAKIQETNEVPQAPLGGMIANYAVPFAANALSTLIAGDNTPDNVVPIENNTNPFVVQAKMGGKIHIKPENRGKFTASAKKAGRSVPQHAKAVLNDPNATPLQKKRANFARNAAKWNKKELGGEVIKYPNGGPYPLDDTQLTLGKVPPIIPVPGASALNSRLETGPTPLGREEMNFNPLPTQSIKPVQSQNPTGINSNTLPAEYTNQYSVPMTAETTTGTTNGNFNIPTALRAASGVGSALLSFQSPEKEQLQLPNFRRGDALAQGTGIDPQALKNQNIVAFNTVNEAARRGAGTVGQMMNRLRANTGQLAKAQDQALLTAKQYNDQMSMQRAGRADRIASINANERIRKQIADSQNQAMSQDQMQNFFNQMTNVATGVEKKNMVEKATAQMNQNQKRQFLLNLATLGLKNPNFKPSSNLSKVLENIDNMSIEDITNSLIEFNG